MTGNGTSATCRSFRPIMACSSHMPVVPWRQPHTYRRRVDIHASADHEFDAYVRFDDGPVTPAHP
jgi:hypothetical protein